MDERMHIRRPSDEASNILRKFSGAGLQYAPNVPMNLGVSLPEKAMSFPRQASLTLESPSSYHDLDMARQQILGRCVVHRVRVRVGVRGHILGKCVVHRVGVRGHVLGKCIGSKLDV